MAQDANGNWTPGISQASWTGGASNLRVSPSSDDGPTVAPDAAAVEDLSIGSITPDAVSVNWTEIQDTIYTAYRSSVGPGGPWTQTSESVNDGYEFSGLTVNTQYWFKITSHGDGVNYSTNETDSNVVTVAPVENLSGSVSSPQIVTWDAPASGEVTGYSIYAVYQEADDQGAEITQVGAGVTSFNYTEFAASEGFPIPREGQGVGVAPIYAGGIGPKLSHVFSGCFVLVPEIVSMQNLNPGARFFLRYGGLEGSGNPEPMLGWKAFWDTDPDGAFPNSAEVFSGDDYDFVVQSGPGDWYFRVRAYDSLSCFSEMSEPFHQVIA